MKKLIVIAAVMILAWPILALAQDDVETDKTASVMERIQKAAELIKTSREAREAGIPDEEVAEVLEAARQRGLSPEETVGILAESTNAVDESGPVDNFGAFVQAKLDEGLRGRDLATAIHEEHRHRGKGKGLGKHKLKTDDDKGHKEKKEKHDDDGAGHGKGGKKDKGDK